jgi:sulfur-oxidizing protein SoxB
MSYAIDVNAKQGSRISDMRLGGKPIEASKTYKVAGWAPVAEANKNAGPPIWDVVETYLKSQKTIAPIKLNTPRIIGVEGNPGIAKIARLG